MARRLIVICLLFCVLACSKREPVPAFYHWKTTVSLSDFEGKYLDSLHCNTLYVKCLDIGLNPVNGKIEPLSRTIFSDTSHLLGREIIPCVFIKNEVFQGVSAEKTQDLAQHILRFLGSDVDANQALLLRDVHEIQMDCDWNSGTRDAYFRFLKQLKAGMKSSQRLSATIRLHQYKFPEKTGVPPIDRGMLMLYNTGDIDDPEVGNSIFEVEDARKYLHPSGNKYPLPLDLALPLFQWGLVYRDGELWKIIDAFPEQELLDTSRFYALQGDVFASLSRWELRKNTFVNGYFLRPGDQIRVEKITPALLARIQEESRGIVLAGDARIAFFYLDSLTCARFGE